MKKILTIFLLMLLIPITTIHGYYCKNSEKAKYKGLASNITTTYEYVETDKGLTFSITLVNLNKELYIVDANNEKIYNYKNNELTISGYSPGQTVKYNVYPTNQNCSDELLYTIRVVLPDYNPYYNDPICVGIEDYAYCKKWTKQKLNYDEFVKKATAYKASLTDTPIIEEEIPVVEENLLLKAFLDFLLKYYHIILITIILICSIIIYNVNKKSDIYR